MLTDINDFVRYFDGVQRRTLRDIQALPETASGWAPAQGEGENGWTINRLIAHICTTRRMFVNAYLGVGWDTPPEPDTSNWQAWAEHAAASAEMVKGALAGTPNDWLQRRVVGQGTTEMIAGWRLLMMLVEHEVHHRSQIDTYAGINGWEPPQIYGRRWEDVEASQASQARFGQAST